MSKIVLQAVNQRLTHPEYGYNHSREFISCDLARPAIELQALSHLLSSIYWIEAIEQDGMLYFKQSHDVPYALQERSLHQALGIARDVLAQAIEHLPESIKEVPDAIPTSSVYNGIYTRESGKFEMPEGYHGPGFVVVEETGGHYGYFIISRSYYHDKSRALATSLLSMFFPEAGIQSCYERGYGEIFIAHPPHSINDVGAACIRTAQNMIGQMKKRMMALQYEGKPSAFLDEDDNARDVLLGLMNTGVKIQRQRRTDADYHDIDGNFDYQLDDGSPLSVQIVERLLRAGFIVPEDGRYGNSETLIVSPTLPPKALSPRTNAVPFSSFQSYCSYRRHPDDGERECVQPNHHGYNSYCTSDDCPILCQTYSKEYGDSFNRVMDEDPAFESHLLDDYQSRDPLMEAIHDNTRRSGAWRAAGEGRMMGVVNQVLSAHLQYGIPLLLEKFHVRAVDEAVAAGWLEIVETNCLGVIAKASTQLLEAYFDQQELIAKAKKTPAKV